MAVVAPRGESVAARRLQRCMDALSVRGRDHAEACTSESCTLGVCRFGWEFGADFSGMILTASDGGIMVAADASLFYKADLRRKLTAQGIRYVSSAPAHLILAAYRAWGAACTDHLEGDYAFVVWDRNASAIFAARDFAGRKPLFHAMVDGELVVASSIRAVLAYPGCPADYDVVAIAEQAGSLSGSPTQTCYRAVSRLPAGWCLKFSAGDTAPAATRFWKPPVFADTVSSSFEDGAAELREVLSLAVMERLGSAGPTALSLSGGYDSPAVFALGSAALAREGPGRGGAGRSVRPISISYPPGDPGREDEMILEVVRRWGSATRWVDSRSVPFIADIDAEAAARDEAVGHPFHHMMQRMLVEARHLGASVLLDGHGGDFSFNVSTGYVADLFRAGSWWELAREWRAHGGAGWRDFVRDAVIPALPPTALPALSRLRRRAIHPPGFASKPPWWFDSGFVARSSLFERELANQPPRERLGVAAYESAWYFTSPVFTTAAAGLEAGALREGVEGRSPFMDERVIRFAASRPRHERRSGVEQKRLLRAAVTGLLPDHILAPRPFKTGTTGRYFTDGCLRLLGGVDISNAAPLLVELGIIDPAELHRACRRFRETGSQWLAGRLLNTLTAEAWLRARSVARITEPAARLQTAEVAAVW
jgi:asparagine synthase (glutamine-hydrolysing)